MTGGERWARIDEVLQKALAQPASERVQFVQQICAADTAMCDEVMSLLAHADSAESFLERSPARQPLQSGEHLGTYQIKGHIGSGGMGEVYRAHDGRLNRDVALKLLPPDSANDERRARFSREAQAIAALSHPGIVVIHTVEQHDGYDFLTMEMVDGTSLDHLVVKGGLPLDRLLSVATQLADAVGAAHECGVVHRDLKPANVMVTSTGRLKVLDFGLAVLRSRRFADGSPAKSAELLTGAGQVMGTLAYMSPEQAEGRDADHRSDIYSLGVILYELAAGARPSVTTAVPIAELRPDLPGEFGRLVRRCLAVDPARRFQSALDLRNELEEIEEKRRAPEVPVSVTDKGAPGARRWIVPVTLAAVVLIMMSTIIMFALKWGPFAPAPPLDNAKFLVTAFHNRTGEMSLYPSLLLADSITNALPRLPGIQAFRSPTVSAGRMDEATDDQAMRTLAEAAGAGRIVSGGLYLEGQTLRAVLRVTDTRTGQPAFTFDPIRAPRDDVAGLAKLVESRVLGAVAMDVDIGLIGQPHYRASLYEVQLAIRQFEATQDTAARERLIREAVRRDPRDARAASRLFGLLRRDRDRLADAAKVSQEFEAYYSDLTPYEQAGFRADRARFLGRWDDFLVAAQQQVAISNSMEANAIAGDGQLRLHKPQSALPHLRTALDSYDRSSYRTKVMRDNAAIILTYLMNINHEAARYEDQLKDARRGQELHPDNSSFLNGEASALVALGRLGELRDVRRKVDAGGHNAGAYMTFLARELRVHDRPDELRQVTEDAVTFYQARVAEDAVKRDRPTDNQFALAVALMIAGKWQEAHAKLTNLTKLKNKEPREEWLGSLGVAAAQLNRPDEARRAIQELERLNPPYQRWRPHYERARIWAALGDVEKAMNALRSADAQGRDWLTTPMHREVAFEKIRDDRAFKEYLVPKG